jgi:voltage-gated potassium channel
MEEKTKVEELTNKIKILLILVASMFLIGIIGFMLIKDFSIQEAAVLTLQSMAFMFEEETGVAKGLEIFIALFGVVILGLILESVIEIFLGGKFSEYLKTSNILSKVRKMRKHYIIAGGGRVGEELANDLIRANRDYVIVEKDAEKVSKLRKKGYSIMKGDVTDADNSDLIDAGIKNAKAIILAMPETEKNLLMTMTAKEINPDIDVYARADNPAFVSKLKKAGAKTVINPEVAAAERFAQELGC